tara:strand:+ start:598 stop:714 length:117 start_codon:yes stop_codon:yes gene_type:complete
MGKLSAIAVYWFATVYKTSLAHFSHLAEKRLVAFDIKT